MTIAEKKVPPKQVSQIVITPHQLAKAIGLPPRKTVKTWKMRRHIAVLIEAEVAYFNGWLVSDQKVREACENAAKRIMHYLNRRKP